jgi:hypothetical protein
MADTNFNKAFFQTNARQVNNLNNLIAQSQATLACGPTCQKIKKTEELKQKYIDAQTNVISAPDQLFSAQKNFILFSQGVGTYNEIIEKDLTNKANKIASAINAEFEKNIENAENLTATYGTLESQNDYMQDLRNKYILENTRMKEEINGIFNDIVTNDRKTYYQDQNMTRVNGWYNLYTIIYVIMMIAFLIFIFLVDSKYSLKIKILVFLIFCGYPWFSKPIAVWIIARGQHIASLLPKNIYTTL